MRTLVYATLMVLACWFAAQAARAADIKVPERVPAGEGLTIQTNGSGDATLYLFGPGSAVKRTIKLGQAVQIKPEEVRDAGQYTVIINGDSDAIVPVEKHAKALAAAAPRARLIVLPGIGHMPHYAAADRVVVEIEELARMVNGE